MDKQKQNAKLKGKEPVFIVKPVLRNYGLDYLHMTLIVLVVILIVLAFALSTFKQSVVIKNCSYGSTNSTCNSTVHNSTQVIQAASRYLVAYTYINTSLSLIPYYALINQSKASYLLQSKQWLVVVPYIDPLAKNETFNISILLDDSNLSLAGSFIQTIKPTTKTNNSVVALGTISLYGETACNSTKPIPIYVITDPYAPGALSSLSTAVNESRLYGNSVNVRYYYIFSGYATQYYNSFGINQTQLLGQYMLCASGQPAMLQDFISNLSIAFYGRPLQNQTLYDIMLGSGLNKTEFAGCMQNSTRTLNIQAQFARLYGITSASEVIVNCRYETIPQTMSYAINYSLKNLKG